MQGQTLATSISLLQRLKARDEPGWQRLLTLFGPTVYGWCRHAGLSAEDAAGKEKGTSDSNRQRIMEQTRKLRLANDKAAAKKNRRRQPARGNRLSTPRQPITTSRITGEIG
jgi:hypothetical protein